MHVQDQLTDKVNCSFNRFYYFIYNESTEALFAFSSSFIRVKVFVAVVVVDDLLVLLPDPVPKGVVV